MSKCCRDEVSYPRPSGSQRRKPSSSRSSLECLPSALGQAVEGVESRSREHLDVPEVAETYPGQHNSVPPGFFAVIATATASSIRAKQVVASGESSLHSLAADASQPLLTILGDTSSPLSLSRLKRYYGDVEEIGVSQKILILSAGFLEVIHAMTIAERLPVSHLDLGKLVHLRINRFSIPYTSLPRSLMWASLALVETILDSNMIEEVIFTLLGPPPPNGVTEDEAWGRIDNLLTRYRHANKSHCRGLGTTAENAGVG
ncbi:hypothetical protein LshimejAT787_0904040 [Lyophyllum shimeji]|uniref:Uncharacterized protein n=1 Tax=Lyophyllum shimeji TaxID=47721 RepID=A0A9P3PTE4_LYOSH|nr:hypothetical protein LshimejAT787_0904040 [Lyophyllum shimeji]